MNNVLFGLDFGKILIIVKCVSGNDLGEVCHSEAYLGAEESREAKLFVLDPQRSGVNFGVSLRMTIRRTGIFGKTSEG